MKFNFFKKKNKETKEEVKGELISTTEILLRYSYQWNEDVPDEEKDTPEHPSRPCCKKVMEANKLYTRSDNEKLSERLGYSVWDRKGGDGCRYRWVSEVYLKNIKQ